jgi:hypothetical protein
MKLCGFTEESSTLLVTVAHDAGAVYVVVSGPRLLKTSCEREVMDGIVALSD